MCHTLHASAGEEDWHRACVTLAQFDVLCPRTGTTVGGIAMCHNHHHPLLCRISPHTCVPLCVCVWLFLCRYTVGPFVEVPRCGLIHSVGAAVIQWRWFIFSDPRVLLCIEAVWRFMFLHHVSPQLIIFALPAAEVCVLCLFFPSFFCSTAHSRIETAEHDIFC